MNFKNSFLIEDDIATVKRNNEIHIKYLFASF